MRVRLSFDAHLAMLAGLVPPDGSVEILKGNCRLGMVLFSAWVIADATEFAELSEEHAQQLKGPGAQLESRRK